MTGERFEYAVKEVKIYEFCVDFRMSNVDESNISYDIYGKEWEHNAGRQCFERKIREEELRLEPRPL